ncbi:hypothetical protein E2C01_073717 [Portunus trituberculatus]|uniref:Uncharacterized protein n=1 Tax=Portunus trituberculatus TaxID=210409 RepID=A0A5B7I634_PORTR|nr:hypothetical protein [Portunus trituberculatus]
MTKRKEGKMVDLIKALDEGQTSLLTNAPPTLTPRTRLPPGRPTPRKKPRCPAEATTGRQDPRRNTTRTGDDANESSVGENQKSSRKGE